MVADDISTRRQTMTTSVLLSSSRTYRAQMRSSDADAQHRKAVKAVHESSQDYDHTASQARIMD